MKVQTIADAIYYILVAEQRFPPKPSAESRTALWSGLGAQRFDIIHSRDVVPMMSIEDYRTINDFFGKKREKIAPARFAIFARWASCAWRTRASRAVWLLQRTGNEESLQQKVLHVLRDANVSYEQVRANWKGKSDTIISSDDYFKVCCRELMEAVIGEYIFTSSNVGAGVKHAVFEAVRYLFTTVWETEKRRFAISNPRANTLAFTKVTQFRYTDFWRPRVTEKEAAATPVPLPPKKGSNSLLQVTAASPSLSPAPASSNTVGDRDPSTLGSRAGSDRTVTASTIQSTPKRRAEIEGPNTPTKRRKSSDGQLRLESSPIRTRSSPSVGSTLDLELENEILKTKLRVRDLEDVVSRRRLERLETLLFQGNRLED